MKRITKLTSLLLAMCMIFAMFAACGNSGTSTEATSSAAASDAASATEESAAAPAEEPAEEPAAADETAEEAASAEEASAAEEAAVEETTVDGELAAAAINNGEIDRSKDLPLTTDGETITYWCSTNFGASTTISSYADHYGLQYAQEQTGVNLEFTECNMTVASEQFSLMVASNDLCDIIVGFDGYYTPGGDNAIEEDLIIDVNDYLDSMPIYQQILESDPQWHDSIETDGGALTTIYSLCTQFAWVKESIAIRGDWLDELGLELPTTYDEYHDVLSAFHNTYGSEYTLDIGSNLANGWFEGGYGVSVSAKGSASTSDFYVEDGVVYDGYTSDRFRDYLTMLHQWYEDGLISSDYLTVGDLEFFENDYAGYISSGAFGCVNGAGGLLGSYASYTDDENFEFVPSNAPLLSEDSTLCYLNESTLTGGDYAPSIAASCENIELALGFLDYFFTEDGAMLALFGPEGVSWDYNAEGNPELTEVITSATDTNGALMAYKVNICSVYDPNMSMSVTTSESAQEIMQYWTDNQNELMSHGNNATYPSGATLTAEESETASTILADISTYISEAIPGFILGTKSLDDWDSYVADLEEMDIASVVEIYQAAYDRYAA